MLRRRSGGRRRGLRLTGRGRLLLVLVVAALLVVAFSIGRSSSTATSQRGSAQLRAVVVQPGDTLWAVAKRSVPGADPRVTVQRIIDLNGLSSTAVVPGQQLRLPVAR
jgi:predicted Zn-dependent protease